MSSKGLRTRLDKLESRQPEGAEVWDPETMSEEDLFRIGSRLRHEDALDLLE